jgi:cytochrome c biogenesis protein ResB
LEIVKYYPSAAAMITSDTVIFAEFQMEGAASAVYVKARSAGSDAVKEGWISCGSFMFPPVPLRLDEKTSLIMPDREPRRFASEVTVYTESGETRKALIEVNKPMSIGGWKIYQLSYDQKLGKWSRYSVFELVSDPWLPLVYTGIGMMLAGALFLFLSKPLKKE